VKRNLHTVAAKGVSEVDNGPGSCTCRGLTCLTPVLVRIGIAFSPYIVGIVYLIHVLSSETDDSEEGIEKVFDKSLWRVNDNFLNAFLKKLLLMVG
jgi:hypothetical protein